MSYHQSARALDLQTKENCQEPPSYRDSAFNFAQRLRQQDNGLDQTENTDSSKQYLISQWQQNSIWHDTCKGLDNIEAAQNEWHDREWF